MSNESNSMPGSCIRFLSVKIRLNLATEPLMLPASSKRQIKISDRRGSTILDSGRGRLQSGANQKLRNLNGEDVSLIF